MLAVSPTEIHEWLHHLAKTDEARIDIIQDLLMHAGEDHMSVDDRTICQESLKGLRQKRLTQGASR